MLSQWRHDRHLAQKNLVLHRRKSVALNANYGKQLENISVILKKTMAKVNLNVHLLLERRGCTIDFRGEENSLSDRGKRSNRD